MSILLFEAIIQDFKNQKDHEGTRYTLSQDAAYRIQYAARQMLSASCQLGGLAFLFREAKFKMEVPSSIAHPANLGHWFKDLAHSLSIDAEILEWGAKENSEARQEHRESEKIKVLTRDVGRERILFELGVDS